MNDQLGVLLEKVVTKIGSFPEGTELWRYFDHGRIILRGPWRFTAGIKWQAIAEPYNETGTGLDRSIEGIGTTASEALLALLLAISETEKVNK